MDNFVQIGYTGKPHGVEGRLKIVIHERYERDALQANVFFIEWKGGHVPFFVEDLSVGNAWIIKLEDVNSPENAGALSGKGVFLRQEDLLPVEAPDPDAALDFAIFIGFEIVDVNRGPVGQIKDVYDLGRQSLAGVEYEGREVLIPLHMELIHAVHEDVRELVMELPSGLLEL